MKSPEDNHLDIIKATVDIIDSSNPSCFAAYVRREPNSACDLLANEKEPWVIMGKYIIPPKYIMSVREQYAKEVAEQEAASFPRPSRCNWFLRFLFLGSCLAGVVALVRWWFP